MDIGLYQLKYPFRKLLEGLLGSLRHVNPNTISWSLLPVGLLFAVTYFFAIDGHPGLYLVAIFLGFLRMVVSTLDGLVAERYQKQSKRGELINRLTPELSDAFYLAALILARPDCLLLGVLTLAITWITTFSGLLGLTIGKGVQSVGPVGQTDRLAALMLFTLLAYFAQLFALNIDFIKYFFVWAIVGGLITIGLRLRRVFAK